MSQLSSHSISKILTYIGPHIPWCKVTQSQHNKICFLSPMSEASSINSCIFIKHNNSMPPPSAYAHVDLHGNCPWLVSPVLNFQSFIGDNGFRGLALMRILSKQKLKSFEIIWKYPAPNYSLQIIIWKQVGSNQKCVNSASSQLQLKPSV